MAQLLALMRGTVKACAIDTALPQAWLTLACNLAAYLWRPGMSQVERWTSWQANTKPTIKQRSTYPARDTSQRKASSRGATPHDRSTSVGSSQIEPAARSKAAQAVARGHTGMGNKDKKTEVFGLWDDRPFHECPLQTRTHDNVVGPSTVWTCYPHHNLGWRTKSFWSVNGWLRC